MILIGSLIEPLPPMPGDYTRRVYVLGGSSLPAPPRSPAPFRFPGAVGMVFDFARLCCRRLERVRSLPL
jgi:hypothetical protein